MNKQQDRQHIVKLIASATKHYKEKLVGKRFIYVFANRYIEVIYKKENFRHLTGVDTFLSALRFYRYAEKQMLAANQIWFSSAHPYSLCMRKIQHIEEIADLAISESLMLEEITTQTKTYKFGTTDLRFTLCMEQETDDNGNIIGDCYVVQSLRDEDCFDKSKQVFDVKYIFVRQTVPNYMKRYCLRTRKRWKETYLRQ